MAGAIGDDAGLWRTFGEREIYKSPYTWLGQVDVELPGGERFWHDVIRLHRAAAMVLVDGADRVLMLWRHRFVSDRWGWELPGGLVDEDEEPAEAAQRELEEETGYRAGRVEPLIAFQPRAGRSMGSFSRSQGGIRSEWGSRPRSTKLRGWNGCRSHRFTE